MQAKDLFRHFDFDDSEEGVDLHSDKNLESLNDISEPCRILTDFTLLILSYETLQDNLKEFYENTNTISDYETFSKSVKLNIIATGYGKLLNLNLNDDRCIEALSTIPLQTFSLACSKCIDVLIMYEEYEKCEFVKNFQDFAEFSQKKLLS